MHPRELAEELTLEDLALWLAYNELEPFGEERADYRAATVAYTTWASVYGLSGKRPPRSVKLEDFLVVRERRRSGKITSVEQMQALFKGLSAEMEEVRRGKRP